MSTIYSLESDLKSAKERLSLIASAFAVVDDVTADGNRAANARQTIRDVLAGHVVHVVSAGTYAAAQEKAETARDDAEAARTMFRAGEKVCAMMHVERDTARAEVAKLTADNAALRLAAAPLIDAVCSGASDEGETAPAFLIDAANRCQQVLAIPNPGAGWVSPEAKEKMRQTWLTRLSDLNGEKLAVIVERDAARARLAEVEADRDRCVDACVFAASIFNLYASHHLAKGDHEKHARNNSYVERMRDAVNGRGAVGSLGELATVHADLARVKAEAEGLRAALVAANRAIARLAEVEAERDNIARDISRLRREFNDERSQLLAQIEPVDTEAK